MEEEESERRCVTPTETSAKPSSAGSGTKRSGGKRTKTPVTVPQPFRLCLDDRVHERHRFNEGIRERIQAAEKREKEVAERREREEKEELKKYRRSLVFKANPIHKYNAISLSPSPKELTVPHSPNLSAIGRRRQPSDGSSKDELSVPHSANLSTRRRRQPSDGSSRDESSPSPQASPRNERFEKIL